MEENDQKDPQDGQHEAAQTQHVPQGFEPMVTIGCLPDGALLLLYHRPLSDAVIVSALVKMTANITQGLTFKSKPKSQIVGASANAVPGIRGR